MKKNHTIRRLTTRLLWGGGCLLFAFAAQAFDANEVAPQGYHPGGINYWSAPYFANALSIAQHNWEDKSSGDDLRQSAGQLNANGYPLYLDSGQILKTLSVGMEGSWHQPSTWPDRDEFYEGQVVLTWKGDADIRIVNASFISAKSNATLGGQAVDGRRVYLMPMDSAPKIEIYVINTNNPITDVKCWLPDPADPQNSSLENQIFHPYFLDLLNDRDWSWIRFMDFGHANGNPQQDWSDRRPGGYAFQEGILNERSPAEGLVWYTDPAGNPVYIEGDRLTGASYETMVALCNETGRDMWINVPHLATDDFITKLAQLIRYGSDGFDPYTAPEASPIYPPLNTNLAVFVEFSNEIWSNGGSFPQGTWAQDQAEQLGISKAKFNARQFSRAWNLFEAQLGTSRVVRVAAVWTAQSSYTDDFINELYDTSLLNPEVMAVTTYFGNGIQNWADDQHVVPTNATPWTEAYWTSPELEEDLTLMFDQWNRYILSGLSYGGDTGYDTVGLPGGFGPYLRDIGIARNLPIIAYEGGPSIYTDRIDGGATEDDGITLLMIEANRRSTFGELYEIHINQAFERGLRANVGFVDVGLWGKFGQWGHLEYLGQPKEEAIKYQALLRTFDEFSTIRSIDHPQGNRPQFDTPAELPRAETDRAYSQTIGVSGGDGSLVVELIGLNLPAGLTYSTNTLTISGAPTEAGSAYVYLRVVDADNDPAWRTFTFSVVKRSSDPAVTIDFEDQTPWVTDGPLPVQPLLIGDYSLFSPQDLTNGLSGRSVDSVWPDGWPSQSLHGNKWGKDLAIERIDKTPFDLFSVEIAAVQADQCFITVYRVGGGTSELFFEISKTNVPFTVLELDLVSILRVDFAYFNASDGKHITGAIDNLKLNQIAAGTYEAWGADINWDGADSTKMGDAEDDGMVNLWEYATDTDPLTSNEVPASITTDPASVYINYRRNKFASDLTWSLLVTSNLLSSWNVWAVDNVRVFSEVLDPDIDGDGSAELMRYQVLPAAEDQSLFFRLGIE